jgi:hypothetical protein
MLVQSYLLSNAIGYGPTMQVKCLEIWLHLRLRNGSWGVGVLECWRCPRAYFGVISIFIFIFLLECMYDARACNLSFFIVERFIWEVWRCLDFKHLTWVFWVFKGFFESFKDVQTPMIHILRDLRVEKLIWEVWKCLHFKAFDLNVLSIHEYLWELWRCLDSNSIWLERLVFWMIWEYKAHMSWIDLLWMIWMSFELTWGVENLIWMIWEGKEFEVKKIVFEYFERIKLLRWRRLYLNDLNVLRTFLRCKKSYLNYLRELGIWDKEDYIWMIWVSFEFSWDVENIVWMI